jgi:hypothetical protein
MNGQFRPISSPDAHSLLSQARAGGVGAALAARRAAALFERVDPERAKEALAIAAQLEPLDPTPRLSLARLSAETGDLAAAAAHAREVLETSVDHPARARAAYMLGELARAQGEPARGHYEQALKIEDGLLAQRRANPEASRGYARARGRLAELDAAAGERERALSGAQGALALLRATAAQIGETPELAADIADAELRLGALELDANQPSSARRRFGEAIGRYEALAVTEKDEPHWRAVLSDAWAMAAEADYARGAPDAAREAMDKSLHARIRLAAADPSEAWALAGAWRARAALRAALGDDDAAADSMAQARALAEQLVKRTGDAPSSVRFLVHTLLDQADHALRANQAAIAHEAADTARLRAEAFARAREADPDWFAEVAACWDRLGETARLAKAASFDAFARAVEFRRMACERLPQDARHARGLAAALVKHGEAALATSAYATAREAFSESAALRLKLFQAAPNDRTLAQALAVALERLGLAALAMGDQTAARKAWEDELALARRIFAPGDLEGERFCAIVEGHLAGAGGPHAEAHRRSALTRLDELARAGLLTEREAAMRKRLWTS